MHYSLSFVTGDLKMATYQPINRSGQYFGLSLPQRMTKAFIFRWILRCCCHPTIPQSNTSECEANKDSGCPVRAATVGLHQIKLFLYEPTTLCVLMTEGLFLCSAVSKIDLEPHLISPLNKASFPWKIIWIYCKSKPANYIPNCIQIHYSSLANAGFQMWAEVNNKLQINTCISICVFILSLSLCLWVLCHAVISGHRTLCQCCHSSNKEREWKRRKVELEIRKREKSGVSYKTLICWHVMN